MEGPWGTRYCISEALQHHIEGFPEHCAGHHALTPQALRQTAIDQGSWGTAVMLIPSEDALTRPTFVAGEAELADVRSYREAVAELRTKAKGKAHKTEEDGEDA